MCTSYWCGGFHFAEPNTYRHVNPAAFGWHEETDPLRERLKPWLDTVKAIVSLRRVG